MLVGCFAFGQDAQELMNKSYEYANQGDFAQALVYAEKVEKTNPNNAHLLAYKADLYSQFL